MASEQAFAVWLTGLPASGKSSIARALKSQFAARGIEAAVLESDELRRVLTPNPRYDSAERDQFYRALTYIGVLLANHGVPVIFDATAHRRVWRDEARRQIARFFEVFVDCPLETCMQRDPKGIYRRGRDQGGSVPGLHEPYQVPQNPEVVIHCEQQDPEAAARRIVARIMA